jgi:hypothetical protein
MLFGGTILMISAFYIVIGFHSTMSPAFVLTMGAEGIFISVAIAVLISYAISIREGCQNYAHSFLKYETGLRPWEKKFFKSCHPFEFEVGNFFSLTTRTFFLVIMSFVVENVINLLVASRK